MTGVRRPTPSGSLSGCSADVFGGLESALYGPAAVPVGRSYQWIVEPSDGMPSPSLIHPKIRLPITLPVAVR